MRLKTIAALLLFATPAMAAPKKSPVATVKVEPKKITDKEFPLSVPHVDALAVENLILKINLNHVPVADAEKALAKAKQDEQQANAVVLAKARELAGRIGISDELLGRVSADVEKDRLLLDPPPPSPAAQKPKPEEKPAEAPRPTPPAEKRAEHLRGNP